LKAQEEKSGLFRIFPDLSGLLRTFPDFSGFVRTSPDFSRFVRICPDFSGLALAATTPIESVWLQREEVRTNPEKSGKVRTNPDKSGQIRKSPERILENASNKFPREVC
jgi:hypothetical protein